jgi:hypothetical protein
VAAQAIWPLSWCEPRFQVELTRALEHSALPRVMTGAIVCFSRASSVLRFGNIAFSIVNTAKQAGSVSSDLNSTQLPNNKAFSAFFSMRRYFLAMSINVNDADNNALRIACARDVSK